MVLWDQSYVPVNLDTVQDQIREINGDRPLPEKEFKTDGCSFWPQGFLSYSWEEQCVEHDIKYWVGGDENDRLEADEKLRDDVNKILPGMGDIIYLGVRAGGRSLVPFPWNWGYGWDNKK